MSTEEAPADNQGAPTTVTVATPAAAESAGPLVLQVVAGPDRGRSLVLAPGETVVGKDAAVALALQDPTVSRRHLVLIVGAGPLVEVRDLGSRNGSFFGGVRFESIRVGAGASFVLGETTLRLARQGAGNPVPASTRERFGPLVGTSEVMRRLFTLLERVAQADTTVLIEGETGVGKEVVARALHEASRRAPGPFVVFDACAAAAAEVELALFGRAVDPREGQAAQPGLFESAVGGTLLLDGVGELDPAAQPRLLRAVERKEIKPVGAALYHTVDVRVIACSSRPLEGEVLAGRLRQDLYHRLAATRIEVPALRERREDIPFLIDEILTAFAKDAARPVPPVSPEAVLAMTAHDWPGNVRQLRNVLEQAAILVGADGGAIEPGLLGLAAPAPAQAPELERASTGALLKFKDAKDRLVQAWEREYLEALLARTHGNVSLAARRAGLARQYLHELLRKHDLARE